MLKKPVRILHAGKFMPENSAWTLRTGNIMLENPAQMLHTGNIMLENSARTPHWKNHVGGIHNVTANAVTAKHTTYSIGKAALLPHKAAYCKAW